MTENKKILNYWKPLVEINRSASLIIKNSEENNVKVLHLGFNDVSFCHGTVIKSTKDKIKSKAIHILSHWCHHSHDDIASDSTSVYSMNNSNVDLSQCLSCVLFGKMDSSSTFNVHNKSFETNTRHIIYCGESINSEYHTESMSNTNKKTSEDSPAGTPTGAEPSPSSYQANDFAVTSLAFHQLDCGSDCTGSTVPEMDSSTAPRFRLCSDDTTYSDLSNSIFNHKNNSSSNNINNNDSNGSWCLENARSVCVASRTEPAVEASQEPSTAVGNTLGVSCSSGALTISNMIANSTLPFSDSTVKTGDERGLHAHSGRGQLSPVVAEESDLCADMRDIGSLSTPLSPSSDRSMVDADYGDLLGESGGMHVILPTELSVEGKAVVREALRSLGVSSCHMHSTAAVLGVRFLDTAEGRRIFLENDGNVRLLILETSSVNVSATVVTVTSPLLADSQLVYTTTPVSADSAPSAAVAGPDEQTPPTLQTTCEPSLASQFSANTMRSVVVRVEQCVWTQREDAETAAVVGMSEAVTVQLQDCIEAVMQQQAALHSPFTSSLPTTPTSPAAQRRGYHSKELDRRLYGETAAVGLQDWADRQCKQALRAAAIKHDQEDRAGVEDDTLSMKDPPIPVLDAVLLSDGAELSTTQLQGVEKQALPWLRVSATAANPNSKSGNSSADASLDTIQDRNTDPSDPDRSTTTAPLFTVTASDLQTGGGKVGAAPPDALRIHECWRVHYLRDTSFGGASEYTALPAVGVVLRKAASSNRVEGGSHKREVFPEDAVKWLYHPGADGNLSRPHREHSLVLSATETADGKGVVEAIPCCLSRRTYALQPLQSFQTFVRQPPTDAACVVQPFIATYSTARWTAPTLEPYLGTAGSTDMLPSVVVKEIAPGLTLVEASSPSTQGSGSQDPDWDSPVPVALTAVELGSAGHRLEGIARAFYCVLYDTIMHWWLPSQVYVQYYQADGAHSDTTTTTATATAINNTTTAAANLLEGSWELLVVTTTGLHRNERTKECTVLQCIPLATTPTRCDALLQLEATLQQPLHNTSTQHMLTAVVVSLTAIDSNAQRTVAVKLMSGYQNSETSKHQQPVETKSHLRRRRSETQVTANKRQYMELTATSYALLRRRVLLQRQIDCVRSVLRGMGLGVLLLLLALLAAVCLVEQPETLSAAVNTTAQCRGYASTSSMPAPLPGSAVQPECKVADRKDCAAASSFVLSKTPTLSPEDAWHECSADWAVPTNPPSPDLQPHCSASGPYRVPAGGSVPVRSGRWHHLMTQYQLRQMHHCQEQQQAASNNSTVPRNSPLCEAGRRLVGDLRAHLRTHQRVLQGTLLAVRRRWQRGLAYSTEQGLLLLHTTQSIGTGWLQYVSHIMHRYLTWIYETMHINKIQIDVVLQLQLYQHTASNAWHSVSMSVSKKRAEIQQYMTSMAHYSSTIVRNTMLSTTTTPLHTLRIYHRTVTATMQQWSRPVLRLYTHTVLPAIQSLGVQLQQWLQQQQWLQRRHWEASVTAGMQRVSNAVKFLLDRI